MVEPLYVQKISFWALVRQLAKARDIHVLMDQLEAKYGAINYQIPVPLSSKSIFIFQQRELVAGVLKKQTKLPFVNKNFDLSHGHQYSINAVNTTDPLWHDLHYGFVEIFAGKRIAPIMEKHQDILLQSNYVLNDALEEFFLKVWSEYCFGPVDIQQFTETRKHLIETLGAVFHRNRLNRLPWVGRWTSLLNRKRYAKDLKKIDDRLETLLRSAIGNQQGMFYELYRQLETKYPNAFQIALDNSFLGILVYDFIYIVMLDAMARIAKTPEVNRFLQVQKSMHHGFLYPFRFRTAEEDFGDVRQGDYCIINLQRAGLYFSSGARYCPGQSVFREIYTKVLEMLDGYDLRLADPSEEIRYNGSRDIPIMQSRHRICVTTP